MRAAIVHVHVFLAGLFSAGLFGNQRPEAFQAKTRDLPHATETERLVVQRIGQEVFRQSLMECWNGRCLCTGQPELLRASHIKAWAACNSDRERLDLHNGLLLAAHLDPAFDAHLMSFADDGGYSYAANDTANRDGVAAVRYPEACWASKPSER